MVADYDGIAIATIQTVNYSYMMLHSRNLQKILWPHCNFPYYRHAVKRQVTKVEELFPSITSPPISGDKLG